MRISLHLFMAACTALLLSACGGGSTGGGSGSSSSGATVSSSSSSSSSGSSSSSSSSSSGSSSSGVASSSSSSSGSSSSGGTSSSSSSSGAATTDVLTYHYDTARSGANLTETTLTPTNVNSSSFGLLRILPADGLVDATPLIATHVTIAGSSHTVVYVATENDSVYAYDADSGVQLQKVSLLPSGETSSDDRSCNQVNPQIGITSTGVIDRSAGTNGTLFVVAMSRDGSGNYHQRLHALDLTTLADRITPVAIQASYPGTGSGNTSGTMNFDPSQYKERGALLLLQGQLYLGWASHCDITPYNIWIMAYSESTLTQTQVLNLTPNGSQGSIWHATGLVADANNFLYALTGNGTFDTTLTGGFPSSNDYGNAAIKLSLASGISLSDYFTPWNTVSESAGDVDYGSGAPLIIPDQTDSTGTTRHLLFTAGKDTNIYLLDRDNMGKFHSGSSSSADQAYQELDNVLTGSMFSVPAYFNGTVYVGDVGGTLKAFTLSQARLPASPTSATTASFGYPGTSPTISANGTSNAIVWTVLSASSAAAVLHAYNPANLTQEYYNSTQAGTRDSFGNGNKFITPVVANGKVFVGTPTGVAVFGLR